MDSHIVQWCSQHRMMLDRDTVAEQWYKSTSQALALSSAQNWSPHELTMIRGSQTMIQEHVSRIALWSPHHDKRIFHTLPLLCLLVCYSFCFKSPLCVFLCLSCPRDIQFVSKILSTCFCFNTLHCVCFSVLLSPLFLIVLCIVHLHTRLYVPLYHYCHTSCLQYPQQ